MADIHSTVEQAERAMWGPTAEAQALLELYHAANDDASVAVLAVGILERYIHAWNVYHTELLRHGRPAFSEREGSQ